MEFYKNLAVFVKLKMKILHFFFTFPMMAIVGDSLGKCHSIAWFICFMNFGPGIFSNPSP